MPATKVKSDKKPVTKASPKSNGGIVHPRYRAVIHANYPIDPKTPSAPPLTADDMKELLGWEEETEANPFEEGSVYAADLTAVFGVKVRLTKNPNNRWVTVSWLKTLKQEHLNGRWRFNGETIVIGEYDNMQSGQHRGLSLILAELEWHREGESGHWREIWPDAPPTMEAVVVYGVKEDDDTFKTLNRGKPGSFAEVLFRSEYLAGFKMVDRRAAAKMLADSLNFLWRRTGMLQDQFSPMPTHGELMDFLDRHPRVIQAVEHILGENGDGGISRYAPAGSAAGMLYLMANSATDPDDYALVRENRIEKNLDFKYWDRAKTFWRLLGGNKIIPMIKVKKPIGGTKDDIQTLYVFAMKPPNGTFFDRNLALARAWGVFKTGSDVEDDDVSLMSDYGIFFNDDGSYDDFRSGMKEEAEDANFEGIDLGHRGGVPRSKQEAEVPTSSEEVDVELPDSEESDAEVQAAVEKERRKKDAKSSRTGTTLIEKYRHENQGKVLLWKSNGEYVSWGADADLLAKILGVQAMKHASGLAQVNFPAKNLDEVLQKLWAGKHKPAMVYDGEEDGEKVVKDAIRPKPSSDGPLTLRADTDKKVLPSKDGSKPASKKFKPGNAKV